MSNTYDTDLSCIMLIIYSLQKASEVMNKYIFFMVSMLYINWANPQFTQLIDN